MIGFISIGDFIYWTEEADPSISPDALIDVAYENAADFSDIDLQMAAEQAIMTSNELWYIKSLPIKGPKGCVSLVPRANWRGREGEAVAIVKELISHANRDKNINEESRLLRKNGQLHLGTDSGKFLS